MTRIALFVILLAQAPGYVGMPQMQPQVRQMPGMVPMNQIVPNMGNPWPRGSVGNPVYAIPQPSTPSQVQPVVPNQPMRVQ